MRVDFMFVRVVVAFMVTFPLNRRQGGPDFDQGRRVGDDGLEFRQVAFKPHARDQIEFRVRRPLEVIGCRLEMMWVAVRANEVDDFHPVASHLFGEVAQQGMQHRDFQPGGRERKHCEERGGKESAKHVRNLRDSDLCASDLRLPR